MINKLVFITFNWKLLVLETEDGTLKATLRYIFGFFCGKNMVYHAFDE